MRHHYSLILLFILSFPFSSLFSQGSCSDLSLQIPGGWSTPGTNTCFTVETGVQSARIFRDGIVTDCLNKPYPGDFGIGTNFNYSTFLFQNTSAAPVCFTVNFDPNVMDNPCGTNAHAMVYQTAGGADMDPYDPALQSAGFLADVGSSVTQPFQVTVEPGFFMIVFSNTASVAECNFQFSITDPSGFIKVPGNCTNYFPNTTNIGAAIGNAVTESVGEVCQLQINSNGSGAINADTYVFNHGYLCGDGSITIKIDSIKNSGWAGIALRDSLNPSGKKISLKTQLNNMVIREVRSVSGGPVQYQQILRPNLRWLRITRSGNLFTGYTSPNGTNWQLAFSTNLAFSSCLSVGAFAEGTASANNTIAYFSNASLISNSPPPIIPLGSNSRLASAMPHDLELQLFPNPVSQVLNINLPDMDYTNVSLTVVDQLGKQVYSVDGTGISSQNLQVEVSDWAGGLYFVQFENKGSKNQNILLTGKFVVLK